MNLIIVESPNKIQTISKYLKELNAKDFIVFATAGHILNLSPDTYSVIKEPNGTFTANSIPIKGKSKIISDLKDLVSKATEIFMCQDDDREGERISHDIVEVCNIKKYYRVTFHAITKSEIEKALVSKQGIRLINEKVVLAQWTRRVIDRIIGYGLSPALAYFFAQNNILTYKKDDAEISVRPNGTGRVVGISLGILAKRQDDIDKYNEVGATVTDVVKTRYIYNGVTFDTKGDKLEFLKKDSELLNSTIMSAKYQIHKVYDYTPDILTVPPYPAFTTASLYSACSYIYDLEPTATSEILQQLFEGGFINYPRTDSYELSIEASTAIINYLMETFNDIERETVLKKKRNYKQKPSPFSQDAHEGIRPIYIDKEHSPEFIHEKWREHHFDFGNFHKVVYELIWKRAVSTQLTDSVYDTSKVAISAGEYTFSAQARNRIVDGWETFYGDILLATEKGKGDDDFVNIRVVLPKNLYIGLVLNEKEVYSYEKKSRTPKRISEGNLISQLVSNGIARPSTLHTVSSSLKKKNYITSNKTLLTPTDLGMAVYKVTETYLSWINNITNAQEFEEVINSIEKGDIEDVHEVIKLYWDKIEEFKSNINYVEYEDRPPSSQQISFANSILSQMSEEDKKNINIQELLSSQQKLSDFLSKEVNKQKKELDTKVIGKCPLCGKNSIIHEDKNYRCYSKDCKFTIWKNSINGFIENFGIKENELKLVAEILDKNKEGLPIQLTNKKNGSTFDTKIKFTYNEEYKKWNISFGKS